MLILENISHDDLKKFIKEFYNYALSKLNLDRTPKLSLRADKTNAEDMFGKTGYYDPEEEKIVLFTTNRHAKDILRSFAHELIHHEQKCRGSDKSVDLSKTATDPAYASHDEGLREMEREAFERGNMIFRDWCDMKKMEREGNIMSEKINEATKKQKQTLSHIKKSVEKTYPGKSKKEATATAHAIKANIEKGKVAHGKGKKMTEEKPDPAGDGSKVTGGDFAVTAKKIAISKNTGNKKELEKQKDIMNKLKKQPKKEGSANFGDGAEYIEALEEVKKMKCEACGSMYEEGKQHACKESKNESKSMPYPELFQQKERLFKERFNNHEEIIFQELMKKFIK